MRHAFLRLAAAGVLAALAGACRTLPRDVAATVVSRWSAPSETAGRRLMAEYGLPDDATPNSLTWTGKGPWKRTKVFNTPTVYRSPDDLAVMEQTVDYPLSREQASKLLAFSSALVVDEGKGELTCRSDREATSFLTLNLADQIARGAKTPEEARVAYRRVLALEAAGKRSPYTERLLFK